MTLVAAVLLGLVAGLHTASWGAFKDSPFEGFSLARFLRSIVLSTAAAVAIIASGVTSGLSVLVVVGLCVAVERLATEWWKAILRDDDQSAYTIPMRLGFRGRPVDSPWKRYAVGGAVVVGLVVAGWFVPILQGGVRPAPGWFSVLVGGAGGWLTAVGGAWKDAPVEGFSGWKFVRSPAVATVWAVLLLPFTDSWLLLAAAAAGWSVTTIETYKTFLTGGRPPGKFGDKPVRFAAERARFGCRLLHAGCHLGLAGLLVAMLLPAGGALRPTGEVLSLDAVLMMSVVLAALVLTQDRGWATVVTRRNDVLVASPPRSPMRHASLHRSSR
jgi:hypothetical protein